MPNLVLVDISNQIITWAAQEEAASFVWRSVDLITETLLILFWEMLMILGAYTAVMTLLLINPTILSLFATSFTDNTAVCQHTFVCADHVLI